MKNADMPAMPMAKVTTKGSYNGLDTYDVVDGYEGLTKREHFAAMAMQGLMASTSSTIAFYKNDAKTLAQMAIANADALLEELDK